MAIFNEIHDLTCDGKCQLGKFVSHASLYDTKGCQPEACRLCVVLIPHPVASEHR